MPLQNDSVNPVRVDARLEIERTFFGRSYQVDFSFNCKLKPFYISDLTNFALNSLLPKEAFTEPQLLNVKGRDSALIPGASHTSIASDELLHINAATLESNCTLQESFTLDVRSEFLDYPSKTSITHSLTRKKKGEFPENIPLHALGYVFPLKLTELRLGIDFFTSQFAVSMLGRTPLVTRTLLIDCDEQICKIRIIADKVKSIESMPLLDWEPFRQLNDVLPKWTAEGSSLTQAYTEKVSQLK